jgi:predicted transcriptional regulator
MVRQKTREITITNPKGMFSMLRKSGIKKSDYDFTDILALRQLLTKEKSRMLHVIKTENPKSIYDLAKKLERGFKSVNDDVKLLRRFGFVDLIKEKEKNRTRYKPEISVDVVTINIRV